MNDYLEAAYVQGFSWNKLSYEFTNEATGEKYTIQVALDETTYKILVLRYKELSRSGPDDPSEDLPYDINGYLTSISTETIDVDYMNSRFEKYLKLLYQGTDAGAIKQAEDELHKTFATLTQEEQKYANIFLHDIQSGDVAPVNGKTLRDYITEYMTRAKDDQLHRLAIILGLNEEMLRAMMTLHLTDRTINEFGRFDALKATVDKQRAKVYFEKIEGKPIIPPKVPMKIDKLLREFILNGGFDIEMPEE